MQSVPNVENIGNTSQLLMENARLRGDLQTVARRISHDLRTPLGGIVSAGDALKLLLSEDSSISLVDSALNSSDVISRLIKRVSFVLQASALPCKPELTDMNEAVLPAVIRLTTKTMSCAATINKPNSWPKIMGVCDQLEVVWGNLLENALKYSGRPPHIELGWREDEGEYVFWVSDNGSGVPGERLKGMFTPFHRLHELNAPRGIGLAIVQRLVELQGGSCGYELNGAGGARFFFSLPAKKK